MQQSTRRGFLGSVGMAGIGASAYISPGRFGTAEDLSAPVPPGTWPMHWRTPQRSGYQPTSDGPTTDPAEAWQQTTNAGRQWDTFLVASEDTAFLSADSVIAYAAEDGSRRWSQSLPGDRFPREIALWRDTLYVSSGRLEDCDSTDESDCYAEYTELYALDTNTGAIRWVRSGIGSLSLVAGGTAICETNEYRGDIVGLDARTGAKEWHLQREQPAVVVGNTLACREPEPMAGVEPQSSTVTWQYSDQPDALRMVTAHEETIYCTTRSGVITAFDTATETIQWSKEDTFDDQAFVATDGETVYLKDGPLSFDPTDNRLLALDAQTGDKRWERTIEQAAHWGLIVTETALYVAVQGGLLVLDPESGQELGSSRPAGDEVPRDLIAAGGQVYSVTQDDEQVTLYAHR